MSLTRNTVMRRGGFALLLAVIIVAIVAVLATVATVTLSGDNDQDRIEKVADVLHRLAAAIDTTRATTGASFVGNVTKYPSRLSQLYSQIKSTDFRCTPGLATTFLTFAPNWVGPYYLVPISTTGYPIASGFTANDILHIGPPTGAVDTLAIEIPNVSLADAQLLELFVNKTGPTGLGRPVKYSPRDGSSPVTIEYVIFAPASQGLANGCV